MLASLVMQAMLAQLVPVERAGQVGQVGPAEQAGQVEIQVQQELGPTLVVLGLRTQGMLELTATIMHTGAML